MSEGELEARCCGSLWGASDEVAIACGSAGTKLSFSFEDLESVAVEDIISIQRQNHSNERGKAGVCLRSLCRVSLTLVVLSSLSFQSSRQSFSASAFHASVFSPTASEIESLELHLHVTVLELPSRSERSLGSSYE